MPSGTPLSHTLSFHQIEGETPPPVFRGGVIQNYESRMELRRGEGGMGGLGFLDSRVNRPHLVSGRWRLTTPGKDSRSIGYTVSCYVPNCRFFVM